MRDRIDCSTHSFHVSVRSPLGLALLAAVGCRRADASIVPAPPDRAVAAASQEETPPAVTPPETPPAEPTAASAWQDAGPPRRPDAVPDDFDRTRALVHAHAIATPDPDRERMESIVRRTGRTRIRGVVDFCIGPDGKTTNISTRPIGDLEINAMLRDTVAGWTYAPSTIDGRPTTTCTHATFDIRVR